MKLIPKDYLLDFKISVDNINTILHALEELPAKICNPLSHDLRQQAAPQLEKAAKEVNEEKEN